MNSVAQYLRGDWVGVEINALRGHVIQVMLTPIGDRVTLKLKSLEHSTFSKCVQ